MSETVLMKGNEAVAEAALRAGLDFYAAYPITPQTEILEYLSKKMPELGRVCVQADSEITAINMIMGAAYTGKRVLTSSAGPGISLKQEGLSYCAANDLPVVYVDVQRGGNGLANMGSCQTEYKREVTGGGNGDYHAIILAPASVQETADMVSLAYELAEKYRNIVGIMTEATIGQLVEPVTFKEAVDPASLPVPSWAKTGKMISSSDEPIKPRIKDAKPKADRAKYFQMKEEVQMWESTNVDDADYVVFAFGAPSRVVYDALLILREEGQKIGMIRPQTLWPYPEKALEELKEDVKGLISLETNCTGQMLPDVALARDLHFKDRHVPVYSCAYIVLDRIPTVMQVVDDIKAIISGQTEEAY
ncbi:MAG: 3-methyl-2-oxobutanoate dehydrogenase subunit beta [Clostridiales Family XIII bacterium]|jgi:2-oxoglutarate ferredoxin oxidoreductase subunit alpha|nr:3-methyl-2-oxobutanoate dehydrogenase subunit beta [Clostridiales Family XIII bacterium]